MTNECNKPGGGEMKRRILAHSVVLLLICSATAGAQGRKARKPDVVPKTEAPKPAQKPATIAPVVKSVLKASFAYKFGKPVESGVPIEYTEFSPAGKRTRFMHYEDGRIEKHVKYTYDAGWRPSEMLLLDEDSLQRERIAYKFENGRLVEEDKYDARDDLEYRKLLRYDAEGRLVEEVEYDSDGGVASKLVHLYDGGLLIETNRYRPDGSLEFKQKTVFENKLPVETLTYDEDGNAAGKITHAYDPTGNMIEEAYLDNEGSTIRRAEFRFEAGKNVETARFGEGGRLESRERYSYDAQGKRVEAEIYDSEEVIIKRMSYEYDPHGNLLHEIERNKLNEPETLMKYTLEYY